MQENADQNNFEYGHFSHSVLHNDNISRGTAEDYFNITDIFGIIVFLLPSEIIIFCSWQHLFSTRLFRKSFPLLSVTKIWYVLFYKGWEKKPADPKSK